MKPLRLLEPILSEIRPEPVSAFAAEPRRRCGVCGQYFKPGDGIGNLCRSHSGPAHPEADPFAYKKPLPPKMTDFERKLSDALTETEQGLYFLYEVLRGLAGPSLPPRGAAQNALDLFHRQFPDLIQS